MISFILFLVDSFVWSVCKANFFNNIPSRQSSSSFFHQLLQNITNDIFILCLIIFKYFSYKLFDLTSHIQQPITNRAYSFSLFYILEKFRIILYIGIFLDCCGYYDQIQKTKKQSHSPDQER